MERFYSLDIKTQYVLQDSVRKDSFKSITTVDGVQWLLWTFYHWGIKYLTYDATMGLQLFHGRPEYDVNTKRWYGTKVVKAVEDTNTEDTTHSTNGEVGSTGEGDIRGDGTVSSGIHNGTNEVERGNITNEVHSDILPMDNHNGEDIERGNTNDNGHGSNNHSNGDGTNIHDNDRELDGANTHSISSDGDIQPTVLGANTREVVEYTDKGNEPKGLSFYLHSLISSVFELSEGTAIELTTQAIEDDVVNKTLTDGTIVEVSNNGVTWFKRYFKSIEPNLSTKYCVYGGGRTKDTVRDMADVEYYQYMRYTDTTHTDMSTTSVCANGCGNCNSTTVKFESVRNTVDGRVVFADRGSLNR
nr:MAG TPA: hypothetical protein [Caudoviricetes sp.]